MSATAAARPAYPRTLVISTTRFSAVTATGSALRSLFGGWPTEKLAQIHHVQGTPDLSLCRSYHQFDDADLGPDGRLSPALRSFVQRFKPEVIYYRTIDEPAAFRRLAAQLSGEFDVPVVTHTMDDWLSRMASTAITSEEKADAAAAGIELTTLIGQAADNLAISDKMATAMAAAYGRPFTTFHNAIDADEWAGTKRRRSVESDGVFRIRFCGGLAPDMSLESVIDVAYVVDVLRREHRNVTMEFSSAPWWKQVFDDEISHYGGTEHVGFLDRDDYLQWLVDADLAVIAVNFDPRSLEYIRYSMSNKAPDYMAAALPILVYGPLDSATVEYAATAGWARTVTEASPDLVGKAIRDLMDHPATRHELARAAEAMGRSHHDAVHNQERLRAVLAVGASSHVQ